MSDTVTQRNDSKIMDENKKVVIFHCLFLFETVFMYAIFTNGSVKYQTRFM